MKDLRLQKADLMRQVEEYTKKEREWDEKLVALNREVNISDEKITGLEDVIARLKIEMEELKNMGKSYKQRSEVHCFPRSSVLRFY